MGAPSAEPPTPIATTGGKGKARQSAPLHAILAARMPSPAVLQKFLTLADGRDKALKIVQYALKLLLWLGYLAKPAHPTANARAVAVVAQFSLTRRVVRLVHAVEPYAELCDLVKSGGPNPFEAKPGLSAGDRLWRALEWANPLASFVNDWVDDVIALAKIGAMDKQWAKTLDMTSTRLWFFTILIDVANNLRGSRKLLSDLAAKRAAAASLQFAAAASLPSPISPPVIARPASPTTSSVVVVGGASASNPSGSVTSASAALATARAQATAAEKKLLMHRVSLAKLAADFVFCWVDFRQLSGSGADGAQAASGLVAAVLGTYKIWVKCS